jgi:hypothetical protein
MPLDVSLGNLCPGAETPPALTRELMKKTDVLLRELRVRPDYLVTYTFYTEEEGARRQSITVREAAEIQLEELKAGASGLGTCAPDLQEQLEAALS